MLCNVKYSHQLQMDLFDPQMGPKQSGPGSKVKEGVLHIPQIFRTGTSSPNVIECHNKDSLFFWREGITPLQGI